MATEPERNPTRAILTLGSSSHGIFMIHELQEQGLSRDVLRRLVRQGVVVHECRGIYRLAGSAPDERQRRVLAVLGSRGVLSHQSAARFWGWTDCGSVPAHVTVPRNQRTPRLDDVVVHSVRRDLRAHYIERDGIRVMKPLWTVLDLAAIPVEVEQLRGFQNHCLASRLFGWATLERFVRAQSAGTPGIGRLRRLVAASADVESVAEAKLLDVLRGAGVEPPVTQYRLCTSSGRFIARLDNAWPRRRTGLEMDGYRYHASHAAFVADRDRHNRVTAAGWMLLHTTPDEVEHNPARLIRDLTDTLARPTAGA